MNPKPFAFVIMPFSDDFNDTYKLGIKPSLESSGYYCERLDEQIFEETMLDRIYNQISKADLIIADLSGRNANVFYETGYAHALGKRTILITRNEDDIPFDLKHFFHIIYTDGISYLKAQLAERSMYYFHHPAASSTNPFQHIQVLVNRIPIDVRSPSSPIELFGGWVETGASQHSLIVPLTVDIHLSDSIAADELSIELRLITSQSFPKSGIQYDGGGSSVYSIVDMPDGKIMHRPSNSLRLRVGDPDRFTFHLEVDISILDTLNEEEIVLRFISEGLTSDISLNTTVSIQ